MVSGLIYNASDFEGNVMTEYEQKFSNKGQVIYRVEAEFLRKSMKSGCISAFALHKLANVLY